MPELTPILTDATTPITARWLFLGDGFALDDLPLFRTSCDAVVNLVKQNEWYTNVPGLEILRYDAVVTDETVAIRHDPCTEHNPQPAAPLAPTRFATRFKIGGTVCRELGGDDSTALEDQKAVEKILGTGKYDGINRVLVLVNTKVYGASSRSTVAWCSLYPNKFPYMALHELGHTFDLSDEYEGECGTADVGQPNEVSDTNVGSDLASLEWTPVGGPALTLVEKDDPATCHQYKKGSKPEVAAWEGALGRHTKYYRPSKTCRMRNSYKEFCEVCTAQIESFLQG